MKIINISALCVGLLMSVTLIASCGDDKTYDFPGDSYSRIYFAKGSSMVSEGAIVNTPVGYIADAEAKFPVRCTSVRTSATKVNISVNNDLVAAYNTANGTSYKSAPAGSIVIENATLTIPADSLMSSDSVKVYVSDKDYTQYTDTAGYIIPIVISSADGNNVSPSTNMGVKYLHISISSSSIKKNAPSSDIKGTLLTDYSNWTGTSNTGDSSTFEDMFNSDGYSGWSFSTSPSTFILDMQKVKSLAGFRIKALYGDWGYDFSNIAIQISNDGATYTDIGKLKSAEMAKEDGYQIVCLYGAMDCRYLKLTVKWSAGDSGSWACKIIGFGAYVK
jgi:hypothetical protein